MITTSFRLLMWSLMLSAAGVGCGGGSSGGSGGGNGDPSDEAPGVPLGSRAVPGATVSTRALDPVTPGTTVRFAVAAAGAEPISTLTAAIGTSWAETTAAQVTATGTHTWTVSVALPQPLPSGLGLLLQLTYADGAVVETWVEDYQLTPGG